MDFGVLLIAYLKDSDGCWFLLTAYLKDLGEFWCSYNCLSYRYVYYLLNKYLKF